MGTIDQLSAIAVQADGKIVASGHTAINLNTPFDFALARFDTDGSLDASFGRAGRVITDGALDSSFGLTGIVTTSFPAVVDSPDNDPNGLVSDEPFAVAVQRDGRIVVAGSHNAIGVPTPGGTDFALARYLPQGKLDPSFGTNGLVTSNFPTLDVPDPVDIANGLAIQADGNIVAVGMTVPASFVQDFAIARYTSSQLSASPSVAPAVAQPASEGGLDPSFGRDGTVITDFGSVFDDAAAIAVQRDGRIVVAGRFFGINENTTDFVIARFNVDGTPDVSFGVNGKVITDIGGGTDDSPSSMAAASCGSSSNRRVGTTGAPSRCSPMARFSSAATPTCRSRSAPSPLRATTRTARSTRPLAAVARSDCRSRHRTLSAF